MRFGVRQNPMPLSSALLAPTLPRGSKCGRSASSVRSGRGAPARDSPASAWERETPPSALNGKRPVILWIHGGAFVGGSSGLYAELLDGPTTNREVRRRGLDRTGVQGFSLGGKGAKAEALDSGRMGLGL